MRTNNSVRLFGQVGSFFLAMMIVGASVGGTIGEASAQARFDKVYLASIQATGFRRKRCWSGFKGVDIGIKNGRLWRRRYHDLKGRFNRRRQISTREAKELERLLAIVANASGKEDWQIEPSFCKYELRAGPVKLEWRNTTVKVPKGLGALVKHLRKIAEERVPG